MKAIGLKVSASGIHVLDLPAPRIRRDTEVKVRLVEVGIDGTDRNLVKHHLVDADAGVQQLVLGHEAWGVVTEVGKKVTRFHPGDPVVPTVRRGCGICAPCRNYQSDYCYTGLFKERGIHKLDGFLAEEIVEEEAYLVPLPKPLTSVAVWTEPLSIIEKAIEQVRAVQDRMPQWCEHPEHHWTKPTWGGCKRAIVIGAGPLGFLATVVLRLVGVETYVVEIVDRDSLRVQLVERIGAHYIDGRSFTPKQMIEGIDRLDFVLEASGASKLALEFIPHLPRNAAYILMGIPRVGEYEISVNADLMLRQIVRHNLAILGSVNSNHTHFENAMKDVDAIQKQYPRLLEEAITHRFPLDRYEEAFTLEDPNQMKVVFQMAHPS